MIVATGTDRSAGVRRKAHPRAPAITLARNVDAADAVLQHEKRLSKIARKYAKHDYEAERARLLREWADYAMSKI